MLERFKYLSPVVDEIRTLLGRGGDYVTINR